MALDSGKNTENLHSGSFSCRAKGAQAGTALRSPWTHIQLPQSQAAATDPAGSIAESCTPQNSSRIPIKCLCPGTRGSWAGKPPPHQQDTKPQHPQDQRNQICVHFEAKWREKEKDNLREQLGNIPSG